MMRAPLLPPLCSAECLVIETSASLRFTSSPSYSWDKAKCERKRKGVGGITEDSRAEGLETGVLLIDQKSQLLIIRV